MGVFDANWKELKASGVNSVEIFNPVRRDKLLEEYRRTDVLLLHPNDFAAFADVWPSILLEYAVTWKRTLANVGVYVAEFLEEDIPAVEPSAPCDDV